MPSADFLGPWDHKTRIAGALPDRQPARSNIRAPQAKPDIAAAGGAALPASGHTLPDTRRTGRTGPTAPTGRKAAHTARTARKAARAAKAKKRLTHAAPLRVRAGACSR